MLRPHREPHGLAFNVLGNKTVSLLPNTQGEWLVFELVRVARVTPHCILEFHSPTGLP
jgi:thiazole synthase ThiGH ThiG subunit